MSQATVLIDSSSSATLTTTAVIPVLNGAVTGTGSAIAAQTTLGSIAAFVGSSSAPFSAGIVVAGADPAALYASPNSVTAPTATTPMHVLRAAGAPNVLLANIGTSFASPTAVASGQNLGTFSSGGYDGSTTLGVGPTIIGVATETWSSTAHGCKLIFNTRANTTTTAQNVLELGQDKSATFSGMATFAVGVTVTTGGLVVSAGGLTVTAGATVVGGNFTAAGASSVLALGAATSTLGFYGVTPIVRAVLATGAGATVDNVITALQNLGLVKQS